jgi:hypothetical protein
VAILLGARRRGGEAVISLASVGVELRLSEVYAGVELPDAAPLRAVRR